MAFNSKTKLSLLGQSLLTLAYTHQFQYPLSDLEVWLRLIKLSEITPKQVELALEKLSKCKLIERIDGYNYLYGAKKSIQTRLNRSIISSKKWQETKTIVGILNHLPWVKVVLITGALAVNNTPKHDDIDMMIITAKNRMWLTRVLVVGISILMGRRRSWRREEPDSWCFNVWVDEDSLMVPMENHSIYTAYEVVQAQPILDKDGVYRDWLSANSWVEDFLPNYYLYRWQSTKADEFKSKPEENILYDTFWTKLNDIFRRYQWWYMKPKKTREIVESNAAYFHPRNTYSWVMHNWKRSLSQVSDIL